MEVVVAAVRVRLQNALPFGEMRVGMLLLPCEGEVEQRGRRGDGAKRTVVADGPQRHRLRAAPGQDRHGGVIAVKAFAGHDMGLDQRVDRLQRYRTGPDLIGERGQTEIDAFPAIAVGLPVQRVVLPELLEQDRRQQVRAGKAARGRMERRRRLADLLAIPAAELLPHCLDHLPLAWNDLQRLGDVLAQPDDTRYGVARTKGSCGRQSPAVSVCSERQRR